MHARFYSYEAGFLSVYVTNDAVTLAQRFPLFRCDSAGGAASCAVGESPGRVLAFWAPDTIVVLKTDQRADQPMRLDLYTVADARLMP